ncbi:cell division protein PerM [Gordonia aurantiaca]|uniref:cell division protein PerM n=1 Tax=Gordonia sp. B21 TaxID=3151852 RepID=UPI003266A279
MPTFRPDSTAENLASQLRALRRSRRAQRTAAEGSARQLAVVAFTVPALALVTLIVVMLTVLLMAGSGLTGLPSAIASSWLAIHQVPVTIAGVTIGVLPLLPTVVVAVGTARLTARAVGGTTAPAARSPHDVFDIGAVVFSAVIGPVLITAMSLAIVMDGGSVLPVQTPNALIAFAYTIGIHAGAALAGVVWTRRQDFAARWGMSYADRRGFKYGVVAVLGLMVAGGVLVCLRMLMAHTRIGELIETGYDFDGYLGLTMLSLMYLPNLMVAATAILVGSDVQLGAMAVDLVTVRGGAVPPVPALAVLPDGTGAGQWGLLGLAAPAAVAVFVGWRCRDLNPIAHVRSIGVAAAVAASAMVIATGTAGGELGEFGDAAITVSAAGVYTLGWIAVTGIVVAFVYAFLPSTRAARAAVGDEYFDSDADLGFEDEYVIIADLDDEEEYLEFLGDDAVEDEYAVEDEHEDGTAAGHDHPGRDEPGHDDAGYDEDLGGSGYETAYVGDEADEAADFEPVVDVAADADTHVPRNQVVIDPADPADLTDDVDYDLYPGTPGAGRRR